MGIVHRAWEMYRLWPNGPGIVINHELASLQIQLNHKMDFLYIIMLLYYTLYITLTERYIIA